MILICVLGNKYDLVLGIKYLHTFVIIIKIVVLNGNNSTKCYLVKEWVEKQSFLFTPSINSYLSI